MEPSVVYNHTHTPHLAYLFTNTMVENHMHASCQFTLITLNAWLMQGVISQTNQFNTLLLCWKRKMSLIGGRITVFLHIALHSIPLQWSRIVPLPPLTKTKTIQKNKTAGTKSNNNLDPTHKVLQFLLVIIIVWVLMDFIPEWLQRTSLSVGQSVLH